MFDIPIVILPFHQLGLKSKLVLLSIWVWHQCQYLLPLLSEIQAIYVIAFKVSNTKLGRSIEHRLQSADLNFSPHDLEMPS